MVDTSRSGGGVAISWFNRNRLNPTIVKQTDPTQTLEVGQTTTIKIYGEDGTTLLRTATGLTGTTYTYDDLTEIADAGALQLSLTIKAKAVRDTYESLEATAILTRANRVIDGSDQVIDGTDRVIDF